jgi:hypothetical protein
MRPFSRYRTWWYWLGARAWILGYVLYGIVAVSTGVLSMLGAQSAGLGRGTHELARALLAAGAGAVVLRADIGRPLGRGKEHARNLATPLVTWLGAAFDHAALGKLERWASDLPDKELAEAAGLAATNVRPGSRITKAMLTSNVKAMSEANDSYARGQLIGLVANGYLEGDRIPN